MTPGAFPDDRALRSALLGNAGFSAISGLLMLGLPDLVSNLVGGVGEPWIRLLGAGLVLFGLGVAMIGASRPAHPVAAFTVTLADALWVVASLASVALWGSRMGAAGVTVVLGVAGVVALFAALQLRGLVRFARNRGGRTTARSRFLMARSVPGTADLVWDRLRRLDRIGDFYLDLTHVEVVEENGVTTRTCGIGDDARWSERVVRMNDETRELVLDFDLTEGRFPMPVTRMTGGWNVRPNREGSMLTLWYEYTLGRGIVGDVFAALMGPFFRRKLEPVLDELGRPESAGPALRAGA